MKSRLLASFILLFLFVINALGNSSAVVLGQERNKNELVVTRITAMSAQSESSEKTGAAQMRKLGLGGNKLMAHKEPSMVSGKEDDALKMSLATLLEQMNEQKEHMTVLEPKASKFTNFVIPRSNPSDRNSRCYCSQDSNADMPVKASLKNPSKPAERQISEEPQDSTQNDETQNLHEAAKEIVNLMAKDYKGMAGRKPPINNHEPRN